MEPPSLPSAPPTGMTSGVVGDVERTFRLVDKIGRGPGLLWPVLMPIYPVIGFFVIMMTGAVIDDFDRGGKDHLWSIFIVVFSVVLWGAVWVFSAGFARIGHGQRRKRYHHEASLRLQTLKGLFVQGLVDDGGPYEDLRERFEEHAAGRSMGERLMMASKTLVPLGIFGLLGSIFVAVMETMAILFEPDAWLHITLGSVLVISLSMVVVAWRGGFAMRRAGKRLLRQEAADLNSLEDHVLREARQRSGGPSAARTGVPGLGGPTMSHYAPR